MSVWLRAFKTLSPAGTRGRLSTVIFHRVLPEVDPLFPDTMHARRFDALCGWLRQWFCVLPLDEAVSRLASGTLPERAMAITFDDGYADNHDIALPILQRHGLSATFFVATGFLDGGRMWNDSVVEALRRTDASQLDFRGIGHGLQRYTTQSLAERREVVDQILSSIKHLEPALRDAVVAEIGAMAKAELPSDLMLRSDQVVALHRAGMQIGAHTVNHPILAVLDDQAIAKEISDSRDRLCNLLGAPPTLFAYPNGRPNVDYTAAAVGAVQRAGFTAAVSTAWGASSTHSDRYQLPRFTPWDEGKTRFGARMLQNLVRGAEARC